MSVDRQYIIVELEVDQCTRTYGVGACTAGLGINGYQRKCYNSWATCQVLDAFDKGVNTLKFCIPSYPLKGQNHIPALRSVDGTEQMANISGYDPNLSGLGKRANLKIEMIDFTDRDVLTDKYWQERMSGAAQTDEPGYDPKGRSTFWAKFKRRNPNYAGRRAIVKRGTINAAGAFVVDTERHYVMDNIAGPDNSGRVTITVKDILSLAEDEKAQAPLPSSGRVSVDMSDSVTTMQVDDGAQYPASGWVVVGSEIMSFTRTGNNMTVTRGQMGSVAASHTAGDTVQLAFYCNRERVDSVLRRLLVDYAKVPAAYIPMAEWQAEASKWGNALQLTALIPKPNGVTKLIGEICQLGVTVWWDDESQLIRMRLNHPEENYIKTLDDRNSIISFEQDDNDDERASRVLINHVQRDPTKELAEDNFDRAWMSIWAEDELPIAHNQSRTHTINTRWLNQGADNYVKVIARRILNRYRTNTATYTIELDPKDDLKIGQVANLDTQFITDDTGKTAPVLCQVYSRETSDDGNLVTVKVQKFQFNERYGVITENSRPNYNASTAAQKKKGTYISGPSLRFADGQPAYRMS